MGQELFKTNMGVGYRNENEAYNVQSMKHYKNRLKTCFTNFREWKILASRNGQDMSKLVKKSLRSDFDTTVWFIVHFAVNNLQICVVHSMVASTQVETIATVKL